MSTISVYCVYILLFYCCFQKLLKGLDCKDQYKKYLKCFALIFSAASWKLTIAEKRVLLTQVINISETSHSRNTWMYGGRTKMKKPIQVFVLKGRQQIWGNRLGNLKDTRNKKVEVWLTFCMAVFAQLLL